MGRSWTFGQKLALGFAAMVALNLVVSAVAVYALRSVVTAKDRVITVDARKLIDAQKMETASLERIAASLGHLLTGDEVFLSELKLARQAFEQHYANIRDVSERREMISALDRIRVASVAQSAAADQIREQREADPDLTHVVGAFQELVVDRNEALRQAITDFVTAQEQQLNDANDVASRAATAAIGAVVAFVLVSVATAAVLGVAFSQLLSRQIGSAVQHIQSSSSELQAAANQQTAGAKEQVASMAEISTTIRQLLAAARQIAESAQGVARIAGSATMAAEGGTEAVHRSQDQIAAIRKQVDQVVEHMLDLGKRSQQIGSILEIINELAEQTNILAINAAIEAAGAGDAGKRFAVVADEIRKLADRVGSSAKEIRTLIDLIRTGVHSAVLATESSSKAVDAGAQQFADVTGAFHRINDLLGNTTQAAREIELSTKQQSSAVEQVNLAVGNVAQAARESEASSSQVLQTVGELTGLSRNLGRLVAPESRA